MIPKWNNENIGNDEQKSEVCDLSTTLILITHLIYIQLLLIITNYSQSFWLFLKEYIYLNNWEQLNE